MNIEATYAAGNDNVSFDPHFENKSGTYKLSLKTMLLPLIGGQHCSLVNGEPDFFININTPLEFNERIR